MHRWGGGLGGGGRLGVPPPCTSQKVGGKTKKSSYRLCHTRLRGHTCHVPFLSKVEYLKKFLKLAKWEIMNKIFKRQKSHFHNLHKLLRKNNILLTKLETIQFSQKPSTAAHPGGRIIVSHVCYLKFLVATLKTQTITLTFHLTQNIQNQILSTCKEIFRFFFLILTL